MGALYLGLLYLATAAGVAALLGRLLRPEPAPSRWSLLLLTLLPLAFTAGGFQPGRVLAPTNSLLTTPPWLDPELTALVEAESSPPNPLLLDPLAQMIPWRRAARQHLLINPAQGSGAALLGNGQSAVLFPTEILARVLTPLRATTYSQAARLLLAICGLYLLARSLALSDLAAVLGAAAWAGCGFLQLWRLHPHSLVAAMAPWIVWAALRLARRPGLRPALALATTGALGVAAGHPETLLHTVLLAAVLAVATLAGELRRLPPGRRWRHAAAAVGAASLTAVLAFLLAAPALLPFVENLRVSAEWAARSAAVPDRLEVPWGEALERLSGSLTPFAFGDPRVLPEKGPETAPENMAELGGGGLGAAALLLAFLALGASRRRAAATPAPGPSPWVWLAVGILGLLVAAHVPGISQPFGLVRLLETSLLKRLSLWWALAASILAAMGIERLLGGELHRGRRRVVLAATGGLALLLALAAAVLPGARMLRGVPLELAALALVAGAAWILAARRGERGPSASPAFRFHTARRPLLALTLALILPRLIVFHDWVPRASAYSFYPDTLGIREVVDRMRDAPPGTRVAGLDAALLPHAAVGFGFEEARAYDPMTFEPYQRFLETLGEMRPQGGVRLLDPALPGLGFLGVRWIFDHPTMTHRPGVEVVYLGRDAIVYENPRALPRAFVPAEIQVVAGEEEAFREVASLEDFARRGVVRWQPDLPEPGLYPNGAAEITSLTVEPGRITADVRAGAVSLVATSQPAIPGWRLYRDGEEFAPLSVDGAFLGAAVLPGESRLELVYDPASWRRGKLLFALGLALAAGLLLARRRRA